MDHIPTIKECQERLIKLGYHVGPEGADGKGGKNTQAAIFKFQKDKGLTQTGQFDQKTLDRLFSRQTYKITDVLSWAFVLLNLSQGKLNMNKDQFINLVQTLVNVGSGLAVSYGVLDQNTWVAVGAGIVAIATYVYTHYWNKTA